MKDKIRTEYLRRVRKSAKSELYARNLFIRINQWVLDLVRNIAGIVDWTRGDGLFHPCANVTRLHFEKCEGGRGLPSAKGYTLRLWDYLEKSKEPMLKEVVKEDFMMEKEGKKEYHRRTKERNETKWIE